ncbi:unnamed protein product [Rhizoctonia solani]|uniref:CHAT domain-containing protein n=1 Tax=Rhizoctonia solani TaxID=456999 RepID=A0A8H2XZU0_9AGAM|nr:unnamed protein product [Rhizoctonia solani]
MTPDDHPDFPRRLACLGASHSLRFERLGRLEDLHKSIDYESQALTFTPNGHPELLDLLTNLGLAHKNRFLRMGDLAELDTAISHESRAIGQRERGAERRPVLLIEQEDDLASVLAVLWNDIDIIKPTNDSNTDLPQITWCPTGALSFLPLHAAGDYNWPRCRVFDYVILSYTPALTALFASSPSSLNRKSTIFAIGQANIPGHSSLPGTANESGPTKSVFFLHDGILDLDSINKRSFKNKGLAFQSACQTAAGDEKLPDEAIHLTLGMLMARYLSVIATIWSVHDDDAPLVAGKVYAQLMRDRVIGKGEAGKALHNTFADLRDKLGEKAFGRWVPYIHVGS